MAILPVHQMINTDSDPLAAVQRGVAFGQQQRALGEARADRQALRDLTPRILAGDPDARAQALAIDRQAAGELDDAASREGRKLKNWYDYTNRALAASRKTGDFTAVNAALRAGAPYVSRALLGGRPAPTAWTPDMDAGWQELGAKVAMMDADDSEAPTGFREAHMKAVAAGYVPGSPEYQNAMRTNIGTVGRAPSGGFGFELVRGADGRERMGRKNPRTGQFEIYDESTGDFVPMGGGADLNGAPQAPPPAVGDGLPVVFDQGPATAPPQVRQALTQREWTANTPDIVGGRPAGNPALAVGQTPAEVEAAKTAARLQAEVDYAPQQAQAAGLTVAAQEAARTAALPAQEAAKAAGAGQAQAAKDRAAAQVELEQMLPKVRSESARIASLIRGALDHPGRAASTGLSSLNPLNLMPGSPQRDFAERLEQLKGANFLQAFQSLRGGGAITQVEGTKAEQAIARMSTAQSDGAFVQALQELLDVAEAAPRNLERRIMEGGQAGGDRIITSPDGRRWRVVGGDPNDPDVEEVR